MVSDLYNVKPALFGVTDNLQTAAKGYGKQSQMYNGFQLNVTARPRNGLTVQGGLNTGSTVVDSCDVRQVLLETAPTTPYCHDAPGFVTRVTGLVLVTIPKIDTLVSGTFRSDRDPRWRRTMRCRTPPSYRRSDGPCREMPQT